jgi:hypothetical protein
MYDMMLMGADLVLQLERPPGDALKPLGLGDHAVRVQQRVVVAQNILRQYAEHIQA